MRRREDRTSIINVGIRRNNGRLEANFDSDEFNEIYEKKKTTFCKESHDGLTRNVFLHEVFHGDRDAMNQAMADGEAFRNFKICV